MDPRLRMVPAALVLAIPAAMFALNAFISFQERGVLDPVDLLAAAGFGALAFLVWRRSRVALYAGIALAAIYLVSALVGGPIQFVAYWIGALALLAGSLRVVGARPASA